MTITGLAGAAFVAVCVASLSTGPDTAAAPPAAAGPTTRAAARAAGELRSTAEARRIQAFQRLREAQDSEQAGRFSEARNLYRLALELDPNNTAAREGRERAARHLAEAEKHPPTLSRTERRIMGNGGPIRYDFNSAVEEADKAVAAKQFGQARGAWRRAWEATERQPEIFAPSEMEKFRTTLQDLRRRIGDAETAEIQAQLRAGRPEAATRIEAERAADAERHDRAVRDLVRQARLLIENGSYGDAGRVVDQVRFLDPRNEFALGTRPLLNKIGDLERERHPLTAPSPATAPSTRPRCN